MKIARRPKPVKSLPHRITALLLALMLTVTVFSPAITVHADREGGGHVVMPGGDDESSERPTNTTFITDNEDGTRTLTISQTALIMYGDLQMTNNLVRTQITGAGHFVQRSYYWDYKVDDKNALVGLVSYIFSDKSFEVISYHDTFTNTLKSQYHNGIYYLNIYVYNGSTLLVYNGEDYLFTYSGFSNLTHITTKKYPLPEEIIDSGTLDLTIDDYKEPSETSAVYYKDLDFASISADYKVKYTIEKNSDGHFEFITPDEAGIQFDWINRTDIDGAYVKFNVYGEYYDSFWSTSYTNTYVTFTCERKNDLTYLCRQKDMVSMAKEKCNGSKGYGFVVNYIYVQAFANIDGTMCRSRIYKFNSDLVSDYGNADSEDDEWFPEVTDGESMPEGYEPDPDNPDPEKTEPSPDEDDDTVVGTPIKDNPGVTINDDETYLEAFKQFINVLKQGIAYLGDFPLLVSSVFSFLPPIFIMFIGAGFAVALILRFLGR